MVFQPALKLRLRHTTITRGASYGKKNYDAIEEFDTSA
jgi:hypothetical protein